MAILGAIGVLAYTIANPKVEDNFTEFYALGLEGEAIGYPKELSVGEKGRVIVGIINHEQATVNYRLEVKIDGIRDSQIGPLMLEDGERWEEIVSFTPDRAGDNQKVEFLLHKNGEGRPYLELHLWVNVEAASVLKRESSQTVKQQVAQTVTINWGAHNKAIFTSYYLFARGSIIDTDLALTLPKKSTAKNGQISFAI